MSSGMSAAMSAVHPAARWGGLAAVLIGLGIAAFALPRGQTISADEARILSADSVLGDALRSGNRAVARKLLALQFTRVDADGKVYARRDVLAGAARAASAGSASDVKVRSFGLVATVTGRHASDRSAEVFFLDIWVRQKGAWRALLMQDVPIAGTDDAAPAPASPATPPATCDNPCVTIPYRVRSPAEQDVVATFQAIARAVFTHDADAWAKRVADDFMLYASGRPPIPKSERIASIERQKEQNDAVAVAAVRSMRLAVYDDAAAMTTTESVTDESHPAYRAARVWMKRNGQWLLAISAHTDIK
jgi:hypothetical protein